MTMRHEREQNFTPQSIISITYIEVRPDKMELFLRLAKEVFNQLETAEGLLKNKIFRESDNTSLFITVSMWDTSHNMKKFSSTDAHLEAMQYASSCSIHTQSIQYKGSSLPSKDEALKKLREYSQG